MSSSPVASGLLLSGSASTDVVILGAAPSAADAQFTEKSFGSALSEAIHNINKNQQDIDKNKQIPGDKGVVLSAESTLATAPGEQFAVAALLLEASGEAPVEPTIRAVDLAVGGASAAPIEAQGSNQSGNSLPLAHEFLPFAGTASTDSPEVAAFLPVATKGAATELSLSKVPVDEQLGGVGLTVQAAVAESPAVKGEAAPAPQLDGLSVGGIAQLAEQAAIGRGGDDTVNRSEATGVSVSAATATVAGADLPAANDVLQREPATDSTASTGQRAGASAVLSASVVAAESAELTASQTPSAQSADSDVLARVIAGSQSSLQQTPGSSSRSAGRGSVADIPVQASIGPVTQSDVATIASTGAGADSASGGAEGPAVLPSVAVATPPRRNSTGAINNSGPEPATAEVAVEATAASNAAESQTVMVASASTASKHDGDDSKNASTHATTSVAPDDAQPAIVASMSAPSATHVAQAPGRQHNTDSTSDALAPDTELGLQPAAALVRPDSSAQPQTSQSSATAPAAQSERVAMASAQIAPAVATTGVDTGVSADSAELIDPAGPKVDFAVQDAARGGNGERNGAGAFSQPWQVAYHSARAEQSVMTGTAAGLGSPLSASGPDNWGEDIGQRILWMSGRQIKSADIQLDPPELGSLRVQVNSHRDGMSISFTAHNAATRDLVEQSLPRLREMMEASGMNLLDVNVNQQRGEARGGADGSQWQAGRSGAAGSGGEEELNVIETRPGWMPQGLIDYYA